MRRGVRVTRLEPRRVAKIGLVLWAAFLVWLVALWLLGVPPSGQPAVSLIRNISFAVVGLFTATCALATAVATRGRVRAAWACMAIGVTAWLIAHVIKSVHFELDGVELPFPSVTDAGFIGPNVATCLALLLLPVGHSRLSAMRSFMDGLVIAGSLFLITWITLLRGLFGLQGERPLEMLALLAYPIIDTLAITIGLLVLSRAKGAARTTAALLVVGVVLMGLTNGAFFRLGIAGGYHRGDLIDAGWVTGMLALGLAALSGRRAQRVDHGMAMASLWLPYVPFSVAGVVALADLSDPASGLVLGITAVLVIAVLLRQYLVVGQNQRLLAIVADQALRDPLTGLANRFLFRDRLEHAVELHRRELFGALAVLTLDLDDFKLVNDGLGHAAGDLLLAQVGTRIQAAVRSGDTVARLGGDEFAILIEKGPDPPDSVARRVVEAFDEPFDVDGHVLSIRPSVGLSVAPARDLDLRAETLLKQSDLAMYAAKRTKASGVLTFAADTGLLSDLRRAIEHGELVMAYQPKIALGSSAGAAVGVEALVRWPHPDHGLLTPATFLPLVRRGGLMDSLTELVFELVFADSVQWHQAGRTVPVAVNLFAPSFGDSDLPARLSGALSGHGVAPTDLTLEITEDLVIDDLSRTRNVLEDLRENGIRVSIDDFGSGFSGLQYLRELPVDEVKLDKKFVMPMLEDRRAAAIVRAVIDLAHDMEVTCVAEGVESAAVADRLAEYRCDQAQGYHFSPPVAGPLLLDALGNLDTLAAQQ
ncbi:GGDEF-domain containing protein [Mycobacterium antarcticum]|nr:GGDEF-domain containing protein [Mycolicibacterium sp. TUM20985]